MSCAATEPWPCESETAGGTHPLGAVLCPRHLAGILAPSTAPNLDRAALRVRKTRADWTDSGVTHRAPSIDVETLAAIVALAPLGATVQTWYPRYERTGRARMPVGRSGDRFRVAAPDDAVMPVRARSTAKKAAANGWAVLVTVVDDLLSENVMLKCTRGDDLVTLSWNDGKFTNGWRVGDGQLEQLNLTAASSYLLMAYAHDMGNG